MQEEIQQEITEEIKKIKILCRFCKKETGCLEFVHQISEFFDEELKQKELDEQVKDSRCDDCQNTYGSYSDMQYEALSKNVSTEAFENIMKKTNYTSKGFTELLELELIKINNDRQQTLAIGSGDYVDEFGCINCE